MGILTKLKLGWQRMSTAEKIGCVIDAVCGIGSASIGWTLGDKLSEGKNVLGRACVKLTTAGFSLWIGETACGELKEAYGKPIAGLIDRAKGKNTEADKEGNADE